MRTHDPASKQHPSFRRALVASLAAGTLVAAQLVPCGGIARADEVSPKGKGIAGGALLGAEVVTMVMAGAQVHKEWPYAIGAGIGAIGGGVGGYFVENGSSDAHVPVYMLAGGLALIIPAVVLFLNATRYQPDQNATEDKAPTNGPEANPGASGGGSVVISPGGINAGGSAGGGTSTPSTPPPSGGTPPPSSTPPRAPELSLLHNEGGAKSGLALGLPVPTMRPMWTQVEQAKLGVQQGTEIRVPLVRIAF